MILSWSSSIRACLLLLVAIASVDSAVVTTERRWETKVGYQGLGFGRGNPRPGTEAGPSYIRSGGFLEFLQEDAGIDVKDYGDMNFMISNKRERTNFEEANREAGGIMNIRDVSMAARQISKQTERIARDGRMVLSVGGDHSITIGTVNGISNVYPDLAILYLDAHADINTLKTSPSGNMHGMTLPFAIKELSQQNSAMRDYFGWIDPRVSANNVAHIGLRSVDPGEREIIDYFGTHSFGVRDIDRLGIMEVTKRALEKISPGGKRPVHISFDVDVLDDLEIGSQTGTPEPGGLTLREAMTFLELVHESVNIVSVEFTEVNTALGFATNPKRMHTIVKYLAGCTVGYCRGGLTRKQT